MASLRRSLIESIVLFLASQPDMPSI